MMHEAFMGGTAESHLAWDCILRSYSVEDEINERLIFADFLEDQGKTDEAKWQRFVVDFMELTQDWLFDVRFISQNRQTTVGVKTTTVSMSDHYDVLVPSRFNVSIWEELTRELSPMLTPRHTSNQLSLRYRIEKSMFRAWKATGKGPLLYAG